MTATILDDRAAADERPPLEIIGEAVRGVGADRVFGTPVRHDGVTVLPVAKISGGGGGGVGPARPDRPSEDATEEAASGGSGGGFGMSAKPLGVYVITGDKVRWRPAVDVNTVIVGGQLVAVVLLLTVRGFLKARRGATGKR